MKRNELIASVAVNHIGGQIEKASQGTLRFCILGFESSLVVSVAEAAMRELSSVLEVKISPDFDPDGHLPQSARSDESITRWRHCRLPDGKRAVLFVASHEELQRNDKSIEKITKLETDTLRSLYPIWIKESGLGPLLSKGDNNALKTALQAANETHAARTIEDFSDFVLSIAESVSSKGLPVPKAVDLALPSLRLPSCSGEFERIPRKNRRLKSEWNKIFRRLDTRIRPLLIQEDENGDKISEKLKENFENIRENPDNLNDKEISVIQEFLDDDLTPDDWKDSQKKLVELDWRRISELFSGARKTHSGTLGEQTIKFFEDEFVDYLNDEQEKLLAGRFPREPSEHLQKFYEDHRERFAENKRLSSRWERYIYRKPKTYNDFLAGVVATLYALREQTEDGKIFFRRTVVIRIPDGNKKSFWRKKNNRVARYLAFRYRGLGALLGEEISLDFGKLEELYFPQIDGELSKSTSRSRDARTIKFEMVLDPEGEKSKLIFYWEMPADTLATSMPEDMQNVANLSGRSAFLAKANIARQSVSSKGRIQRISLEDMNTIRDASGKNDGKFVSPNEKSADVAANFLSGIKEILRNLPSLDLENVNTAFREFLDLYTKCVRGWISEKGEGLASGFFVEQAEAYGRLLRSLAEEANNDQARERLWTEILLLGVANIDDPNAPAAIITPWHPLRLAEIHIKANQAAELIRKTLKTQENDVSRADLLFDQFQLELAASYYPEVCVGIKGDGERVLLSATDTRYDYTLCESPRRGAGLEGEDSLDIEPGFAAKEFGKVAEQYLNLLPHERSNFSIVLYNAESKALPVALASELSKKVEQENELQCDLFLTHSDPKRMRRIYEQQNVAVSEDSGFIMTSEFTLNFLSRLRIGFLYASEIQENNIAKAADLVVLQDVIARNATIVWKESPGTPNDNLIEHSPPRWSRKRPVGKGDMATAVYLASPSQPLVGQIYLNALNRYLLGDNAHRGDVIPAREVRFSDSEIRDLFDLAHRIGEWVVNLDELVDHRILKNERVQVIRHVHDRSSNRNIVVSTSSKPRLLDMLLRERLNRVDPGIVADNGEEVIGKLIRQANELSGQVVLRAARYGRYANELLGIVLSMEQIKAVLSTDSCQPIGWYFLDDFASWFGQREEHIADIMAIAPRMEKELPVLKIIISEAKYVTAAGHKSQARKSSTQLEETVRRIEHALNPKCIDRDIWLHRIGDFMIEGMEQFDARHLGGWELHRWSDEVRRGNVLIELAGLSHVFVCDQDEYVDSQGLVPVGGKSRCAQQVFDKSLVKDSLNAFARGNLPWTADLPVGLLSPRGICEEREALQKNRNHAETNEPDGPVGGGFRGTSHASAQQSPSEETVVDEDNSGIRADGRKVGIGKGDMRQWPSSKLASWVEEGKTSDQENSQTRKWLDETVNKLRRALGSYDMTAELKEARLTPNAALVRFRGSDDLTVSKVERRRQQMLTTYGIKIINVIPEPMEVVIMVARKERMVLSLRDLWRQRELPDTVMKNHSNTSLLLGMCEEDGELLYMNLDEGFGGYCQHGPHTLIAGQTGSGKGVLIQNLLLDICATNSPDNARIRMIDPKAGLDFLWLKKMPHLDGSLIITPEEAIPCFEELVEEVERRYRKFAEVGANKIDTYNARVPEKDKFPRIFLFHDEIADWMLGDDYREKVAKNASRLGVKSRAAGIHLVMITQRPDKDALPIQLRANLTNRLVLKVASPLNSKLVLGEEGAEKLLGRGHLAAKLSGESDTILAQVAFADSDMIDELSELIANSWR